MMRTELAPALRGAAGSSPVTDRVQRGADIRRRRLALGIPSINEFAKRTGLARDTLSKVESGVASRDSMLRVEEWLAQVEADTLPDGIQVIANPELDEETIELTVTGPTKQTEYTFRFTGKASQADHLREQAVRLMLDLDKRNES